MQMPCRAHAGPRSYSTECKQLCVAYSFAVGADNLNEQVHERLPLAIPVPNVIASGML